MPSRTLLWVCCLLPAQAAWGVTWAQPSNPTPKHFGEAMLESPGSVCPCGGTEGVALGKEKFWRGPHSSGCPHACSREEGLRWLLLTKPQPPAPRTRLANAGLVPHLFLLFIFFCFTLLELFFVASTFLLLGQLCKTEGVIKSCRDKQALLLKQKSLFHRFQKQNKTKNSKQPLPHHI